MTGLTYNDAAHRYRLDGRAVPNVTTILNAGIPKPALVKWAARAVAEYVATEWDTVNTIRAAGQAPLIEALTAIPDDKRNRAAARGTQIHALAERLAHGDPVDVPPEHADPVHHYLQFLDQFHPTVIAAELRVANRTHWYAGTADLLAVIAGQTWLLDLKTARGVYGETALQCAAYACADFYVRGIDPPGTENPMPHVDRIGCVHIRDDGCDLYDLGDVVTAFGEFLTARDTYTGDKRRRSLIRQPITPDDIEMRAAL